MLRNETLIRLCLPKDLLRGTCERPITIRHAAADVGLFIHRAPPYSAVQE